jgi:DNA-binding LytR/AlgR family response regulator
VTVSNPMTALIVDDERNARARLTRLLDAIPEVTVVGEAGSGAEAIASIRDLDPRLVFLDIEMPDLDGIEVMRAAGPARGRAFIFVTAHEEYAVDAFDLRAADYLLKPVRTERLQEAVERVRERGAGASPRVQPFRRIVARVKDGIRIIPVSRVISASVEDKVVYVDTTEGRYRTDYDLATLAESLDASFARIHRQHLVSLSHVKELHPLIHGAWRAVMSDGREVPVSRGFASSLRARIER